MSMPLPLRVAVLLSSLVLISACSSTTSRQPRASSSPMRPVQVCNAQAAQWAVGKTNTEANVARARTEAGAYMVRVLHEGTPTTREFNAERLNLEVDAKGRIVSARCG